MMRNHSQHINVKEKFRSEKVGLSSHSSDQLSTLRAVSRCSLAMLNVVLVLTHNANSLAVVGC